MKTLILFWGWTKTDQTHQCLIDSAPKNWQIININYQQSMPHGDIVKFNQSVLNFLKENKIKNFSLMGHSVGGALAAKFASLYPEKIDHLYIINSTGLPNSKTFFSWFGYFPNHSQKYAEPKPLLRILQHPLLHLRLALFSLFANLKNDFSKIKVPATIIWGEEDELLPLQTGEKIHQLIPNSKLIVLKGYTHDWIKEDPEKFWQNL